MAVSEIDSIDHKLLGLLQADGRRTFSDMAQQIGLSIAAVKRRVDRLRELEIITGFTTSVDHSKLGWNVEAFTEVRYVGSTPPDNMLVAMSEQPEVTAAYTISGDPDLIISLRVRDLAHLQQVINRMRATGHITGTKTMIVLGSWRRC